MVSQTTKAEGATPPSHVLIVGAGEFGLSSALALVNRPRYANTQITIVDSSPELPNPSGSSVDASRIVRADYGNAMYAKLAAKAQVLWRDTSDDGWGGQGRYHEPGFLLTVDDEETAGYVKQSLGNVRDVVLQTGGEAALKGVQVVEGGREEIRRVSGLEGATGTWGYVNWNSGWCDAGKCVEFAIRKLKREGRGRVEIRAGAAVERVLVEGGRCTGVRLRGGEVLKADLTVLAAGAWTPSLVDLQGRCVATAQALTYLAIDEAEQKGLQDNPTVMNLSRGMFIIPPRNNELKVARHGFGYRNPQKLSRAQLLSGSEDEFVEVSVPRVGIQVPREGQQACREALREMLPSLGSRPFTNTRLCWYCDTPDGDFLITHHPNHSGLFLATGGSGHGFKFLPILGEKIVDAIEGQLETELQHAWRWREEAAGADCYACEDGSRAGPRDMILDDELAKGVAKPHL
jgi:sarcosine oxidase / L-pipecolate oxidase